MPALFQNWLFILFLNIPSQKPGMFSGSPFTSRNNTSPPAGMGMAKPHLEDKKILYFYTRPSYNELPGPRNSFDSLIIIKTEYHFDITYAPSWFFPEVMKLDYDLLYLRTLTVSKNFLEVVVNKKTNQTTWINSADADFTSWTDFLLNVYDIELIDPESNPLRFGPLDNADILATTPKRFSLQPIAIKEEWIMVSTPGLADRIPPYAWVRWRKGDELLINYSLLS